jgi:hypothetical protein
MARKRFFEHGYRLLACISLMPLLPAIAAAPPPFSFFARRDILPNINVGAYSAVAVADFNGDGRPISHCWAFGTVNVMLANVDFSYTINTYVAPAEAELVSAHQEDDGAWTGDAGLEEDLHRREDWRAQELFCRNEPGYDEGQRSLSSQSSGLTNLYWTAALMNRPGLSVHIVHQKILPECERSSEISLAPA